MIPKVLCGAQMDTWYYSPYPEPYASLEKLHVCEFCLKYFGKEKTLIRHMAKCEMRHPPGDEIYRSPPEPKSPGYCKTPIAVFEVCGRTNKVSSACGAQCIPAQLHPSLQAAALPAWTCVHPWQLLLQYNFILQAIDGDMTSTSGALICPGRLQDLLFVFC